MKISDIRNEARRVLESAQAIYSELAWFDQKEEDAEYYEAKDSKIVMDMVRQALEGGDITAKVVRRSPRLYPDPYATYRTPGASTRGPSTLVLTIHYYPDDPDRNY